VFNFCRFVNKLERRMCSIREKADAHKNCFLHWSHRKRVIPKKQNGEHARAAISLRSTQVIGSPHSRRVQRDTYPSATKEENLTSYYKRTAHDLSQRFGIAYIKDERYDGKSMFQKHNFSFRHFHRRLGYDARSSVLNKCWSTRECNTVFFVENIYL